MSFKTLKDMETDHGLRQELRQICRARNAMYPTQLNIVTDLELRERQRLGLDCRYHVIQRELNARALLAKETDGKIYSKKPEAVQPKAVSIEEIDYYKWFTNAAKRLFITNPKFIWHEEPLSWKLKRQAATKKPDREPGCE